MKSSVVFEMSGTGYWYEQFLYPGGEMQVRIKPDRIDTIKNADKVVVIARIQNAASLIEARLLQSAIFSINQNYPKFVVPYWPYARADRRFTEGDCFGLEVFSDIIFPLECVTLDVHSPKSMEKANVTDSSAYSYIQQAIVDFAYSSKKINVLFPDKGARERYKLPTVMGSNTNGVECNFLNASKDRNPLTGKLNGFNVPDKSEFVNGPTIIVDDICDGGGTFLGIAKELKMPGECMALYVTHGIFSRGFADLYSAFGKIYTTNSFDGPRGRDDRFKAYDCIPDLVKSCLVE